MNDKAYKILSSIMIIDIDTQKEQEVRNLVSKFLVDNVVNEDKYKNVNTSLFVKDLSLKHWKPKDHFTKIFNNEIQNAKELYGLTRTEVLFLYSLSPYLLWETNLLVDEEDNPLNQKALAKLLEIDRKTVQRNMKSLEEKKCIYSIPLERDVFYLVNPNLMYAGQQINLVLPSIFTELGYESSESIRKNRNKVTKNNEIKG
jgi:biotin operon repressor